MVSPGSTTNSVEFTVNSHSKTSGVEKSCFTIYFTLSSNVSSSVTHQRSFAVVFGSHRIQACVAVPTYSHNEYSISVEVPSQKIVQQGVHQQQQPQHLLCVPVYLIICDAYTNEDISSLYVCEYTYLDDGNISADSTSSAYGIFEQQEANYPPVTNSLSVLCAPSNHGHKPSEVELTSSYSYHPAQTQSPINTVGTVANMNTSEYMTGSSVIPQVGYFDTMLTPRTQQKQQLQQQQQIQQQQPQQQQQIQQFQHQQQQPQQQQQMLLQNMHVSASHKPVYFYSNTKRLLNANQPYNTSMSYDGSSSSAIDQRQLWPKGQAYEFQHVDKVEPSAKITSGTDLFSLETSLGPPNSSFLPGGSTSFGLRNLDYSHGPAQYSGFKGFMIDEQPTQHNTPPPLVRTTALSQAASSLGLNKISSPNIAKSGHVPSPFRAGLEIVGDLDAMAQGWTMQEWQTRRRLVQFRRAQRGPIITVQFLPLDPDKYDPSIPCISCIHWEEKGEAFITSVDCIFLLEQLINTKFSVEEKNRIRRNLEGYHPLTVSKGKPESGSFFRLIMSFAPPKPRNIEKDVKVFPWRILSKAIQKIIGKYSADYNYSRSSSQLTRQGLY